MFMGRQSRSVGIKKPKHADKPLNELSFGQFGNDE